MRKSHAQLREELTQDVLVRELRSDFEQVPGHRAPNVVYTLGDILMSAYALFALKYPSLLCFEQQTKAEVDNLENLFGLPGVCSDAQMRRVLDEVSPDHLQGLFSKRFGHLKRTGLLGNYRFLHKYFLVSIDGVEYFNSQQIHCKKCLEKHHRNGEVSYSHSMLGAVLVHPDGQGNVRVNFLYYEEHSPRGKIKRFSWVTSLKLRTSTVYHIMRGGRARWKIENETFNTLKNQGYNFEHNYSHGYKHLCNVLALIMLLAFLTDQIVQATSTVFQTAWPEVKTKARIWEYMRVLFMTSVIPSFKELFVIIAEAYDVQLE